MILDSPWVALGLLFLVAFLPSVALALRLRASERVGREPLLALAKAFAWGAIVAALLALLVESWLLGLYGDAMVLGLSVASVLVAPLVEEVAKGLGLVLLRDPDPEPEDGLIYGAVVGLAFAGVENALYILEAFVFQGGNEAILVAAYRGVVTVPLHAACSAIVGYGVWRARRLGKWRVVAGALAVAVLLHGAYNALVEIQFAGALLVSVALAMLAYWRVAKRVRALDAAGP